MDAARLGAMSVKSAERFITRLLAEQLVGTGFVAVDSYLIALRRGDVDMQIRCAGRKQTGSGVVLVTLNYGMRFDRIESLLRKNESPTYPTLISQASLFHRWPDPTEWDAAAPATPKILADEVRMHAIPTFERFADLDHLIRCLQNLRPIQIPFIIDPLHWILVLAAAMAIRDGNKVAVQMLERRITHLEKSPESSERRMCPPLQAFLDRLKME